MALQVDALAFFDSFPGFLMQLHSCWGTGCSLHSRHGQSGQACSAERAWAAPAWQVRPGQTWSTLLLVAAASMTLTQLSMPDAGSHVAARRTALLQLPQATATHMTALHCTITVISHQSTCSSTCPCCTAGAWAQGTSALAAARPRGDQRTAFLGVLATPSWMLQMLPSRPLQAMPWPLQLQAATWTCTSLCRTGKLQPRCWSHQLLHIPCWAAWCMQAAVRLLLGQHHCAGGSASSA